jgi:hypothetical protein
MCIPIRNTDRWYLKITRKISFCAEGFENTLRKYMRKMWAKTNVFAKIFSKTFEKTNTFRDNEKNVNSLPKDIPQYGLFGTLFFVTMFL